MKNVLNNLFSISRNCFKRSSSKSNISKSIEKETTDKIDYLVPVIYVLCAIFVIFLSLLITLIIYWLKTNF